MNIRARIGYLILSAMLYAAGSQHARGDVTGTILGSVLDQTGAAVPNAQVTLRNPNTGLVRNTTSNNGGAYEFLALPIGLGYTIEARASGFGDAARTDIELLVNQSYRADFELRLGATADRVEVSASSLQVETSSSQLGDVIQDRKMVSLPLNGRSYIDLLGLQPGVVPISSGASTSNHRVSGDEFAGIVSVNGSRESANSFLVNGGDVQESTNNGASVIPTLDSIQEFRLLTNSFGAEYGRFSGAIVNVVTKSGTNSWHGAAYEFLRNEKLDARNFFDRNRTDPVTGQEIPDSARGEFRRNQFGGVFGGPIKKDKLFFFTDYQATRQVRGNSSGIVSVPSLPERGGDFSDVGTTGYGALTGAVRGDSIPGNHTFDEVLSQRLGYTVNSGEPYWAPGCNTLADAQNGVCVFPGQVIPQSAWSPAAKGTLKFIPNPNGARGGAPFFSTSAYKTTVRDDKGAIRIDWTPVRFGSWSFYYHTDDSSLVNPYAGSPFGNFPSTSPTRGTQINVNNTRVFGPTAVNELHLNFNRAALRLGQAAGPGLGKLSSFGFVSGGLGLLSSASELEGVPNLNFDNLGFGFGVPSSTWQFNNSYQAGDNFSKIIGGHTLKFGGEWRDYQINMRWRYDMNGTIHFSGNETGNDFADYLLGAPDSFIQASPGDLDARSRYFGAFFQDAWKVKPSFTVTLGLRWEATQPWSDKGNRLQAFVPGEQSKRFPDAPLGWVFSGDPGIPNTVSPTRYNNFEPRAGLAWSPSFADGPLSKIFGGAGKTSVRAAFGIYTSAFEQISNNFELGNTPFAVYYLSPTQGYLEEPYKDRRHGNDPGQRFPYVQPAEGSTGFWPQFLPVGSQQAWKTDNKLPTTYHYNLTIQRQLSSSMITSIGYVGTQGHHLLGQVEANPGNPAACLQIAAALTAAGRSGEACGPGGEDTIYNLPNGQTAYGTRPYSVTSGRYLSQGLLDFVEEPWMTTWGNSNYNSLQTSLEKRSGAFTFLAGYTFSKSIDDGSGFGQFINPYNHRFSRAVSAFDLRHNFVVSYQYQLPFSKVFGRASRIWDGWDISGVTRYTTGLPVTLTESGDRSLCGCPGADRPDYNGGPIEIFDPRASASHLYVSRSAFSLSPLGAQGTAGLRMFYGPGLSNTDVALHKETRIKENALLEVRAEFFNVFNHAQFMNPRGNISSSNFGRVLNARDPRIGQLAMKLRF